MRTVEGVIKGAKLTERLEVLKDEINLHLCGAKQAWGDWLEHVRIVGKAFQEAYERLGRVKRWTRWVGRNFDLSARTVRDYRRIHREWDHPCLVAARQSGGQPKSIQGVLKILRGKSAPPRDGKAPDEVLAGEIRERIRRFIADDLREMKIEELQVLDDKINNDYWFRLRGVLAKDVAIKFGDDYYDNGDQPLRDWALEQARLRYQDRYNQSIFNSMRPRGYKRKREFPRE